MTDANGYYRIEDAAPIRAYFAVTEHCFPYNYFQTTEITHDQTVNLVVQRPSDRFGHRCDQVTAQTITPTTKLALTGDNNSQAVTLPFPINYYGTTQTTANISTNGLITFGGPFTAAPNETNINGPTSGVSGNGAAPMGSVYAYWDDLVIDSSASVWTGTVGSTGFVVEWRNALIAGTTLRVTVQAVLYADDRVRFQFVSIPDDSRAWGTYTGVGMESPHSGESLDGMQLVWRLSVNANPYVYLQQKQIAASGLAIEFRRF